MRFLCIFLRLTVTLVHKKDYLFLEVHVLFAELLDFLCPHVNHHPQALDLLGQVEVGSQCHLHKDSTTQCTC